MSVTVSMPQLGESVTEGTVTRWLKREGEHVEADEPLLEVSTDKVDTEIPSPVSGVLRGITVAEDETVAVGAELAVIDEDGAAGQAAAQPEQAAAAPEAPPAAEPAPPAQAAPEPAYQPPAPPPAPRAAPEPAYEPPAPPQAPPAPAAAPPVPDYQQAASYEPGPLAPPPAAPSAYEPPAAAPAENGSGSLAETSDGPYVTPLVRKLAAEHGIDLATVSGTGVGGRIRKQDVLEAARAVRESAPAAAPAPAPAPTAPPAPAPAAPAANGSAPAPAAAAPAAPAPATAAPTAPAAPARPVVPSTLRGTTERMSRARQVIARRMVESLQTSAQLTTVVEADVTAIARLRNRAKADFEAREGVK